MRVPKIFNETEIVYLIGGGTSLDGFDFKKLEGKRCIAINQAYRHVPNADIAYSGDKRFVMENIHAYGRYYKGKYIATSWQGAEFELKYEPRFIILPASRDRYFSKEETLLGGQFNSGIQSINLAYLAGARNLVLLGFDCTKVNGRGHFHNAYPEEAPESSYARYADEFDAIGAYLESAAPDLKIYNASAISQITAFQKVQLLDDLSVGENIGIPVRLLEHDSDHKIEEAEERKYKSMWEMNVYRNSSPAQKYGIDGLLEAFDFVGEGHLLADYGCGTGRATLALQEMGFTVHGVDITETCLDEDVRGKFEFFKAPLWNMAGIPAMDYFICCDVMEHIPESKVDAVLEQIRIRTGVGGFFAISTVDDNHGRLIGETLHLTIRDAEWWGIAIGLHFNIASVKINDGRVDFTVTTKGV